MSNFDDYANENKPEHNLKWLYIQDDSCRILIIGSSGSEKTNVLPDLIMIKYICMLKILQKQNINI